jgi:RNA polymerase sigma-70 factor, ECF subfamily
MSDMSRETDCTFQGVSHAVLLQRIECRRSKLLRVALRITRNWEESEDIVQESALKALLNFHSFRGESQIDTWLHSIVVNSAIGRLRSRHWRSTVSLEGESWDDGRSLLDSEGSSEENPEQRYARLELLTIVCSEIEQLKPMYRSVIELCDIEQCPRREAASMLNVNLSTMKARLFRGRKILGQRVQHRIWQGNAGGGKGP